MAGGRWDYPEHREAGILPHAVREKYYFARGPQLINRVVDISSVIDQNVEVNLVNVTQGPAGASGAAWRVRLAREGRKLPILGDSDEEANRQYIKHFVLEDDAAVGSRFGLAYPEPFHYIGPQPDKLSRYSDDNAAPL